MTVSKSALLALAGLFALPAIAAEPVDPARIISAATGDWNQDDGSDLALLVAPPEEGDADNGVYIYLTGDKGLLELKTVALNKVWSGGMYGQSPSIEAMANGSFVITSLNDSIGRDRWEQKLTIAYRNSDFVVAGYTYSSRDTLDPDNISDCDFNVLTGKGKSNDKPFATTGKIIPLTDWTDEQGRKACGLE